MSEGFFQHAGTLYNIKTRAYILEKRNEEHKEKEKDKGRKEQETEQREDKEQRR